MPRVAISVSLDTEVLRWVDEARGDIPRSRFLESIIIGAVRVLQEKPIQSPEAET